MSASVSSDNWIDDFYASVIVNVSRDSQIDGFNMSVILSKDSRINIFIMSVLVLVLDGFKIERQKEKQHEHVLRRDSKIVNFYFSVNLN